MLDTVSQLGPVATYKKVVKRLDSYTPGGRVARLDNFRTATIWSGRQRTVRRSRTGIDKGQRNELEQFLRAVRSGDPMPIGLASITATTRAGLALMRSLASGRAETI